MAADPTQLGIEFADKQEREQYTEVIVGEDVRNFLNSTTGEFLKGRAEQVKEKCVKEMFDLDPYTPEGKKEHSRIKQEAWCANHFLLWCIDAILEGNQSETLLSQYREQEIRQ